MSIMKHMSYLIYKSKTPQVELIYTFPCATLCVVHVVVLSVPLLLYVVKCLIYLMHLVPLIYLFSLS